MDHWVWLAGTASEHLARGVAGLLGVPPCQRQVERFPDGETQVELLEPVRGRDIYLLQATAPPVNEHLVELLALVDACRRAGAASLTAVVPYFGYARSDKRNGRREPIAASMAATCLQAVGVRHLVTVDLHAPQIEGFFQIPVDNLAAERTLCGAVQGQLAEPFVVVAPDEGAVKLATRFARRLGTRVVVTHKERESGTASHVTQVVGNVRDQACLIVDDMISTGGTICNSAQALLQAGARPEIRVAATHGLFTGRARETLTHPAIRSVCVTDSVAPSITDWPALQIASIAPLLGAAIQRFVGHGSLSDLY